MLTAKEAREKAMPIIKKRDKEFEERRNRDITTQLQIISERIVFHSGIGSTSLMLDELLYKENLKILKKQGYKIRKEKRYTLLNYYWCHVIYW